MHIIKISIENEAFNKFMNFLEELPKDSIKIEIKEIDNQNCSPSITLTEIKEDVIDNKENVTYIDNFFDNMRL